MRLGEQQIRGYSRIEGLERDKVSTVSTIFCRSISVHLWLRLDLRLEGFNVSTDSIARRAQSYHQLYDIFPITDIEI